MYSEAVIAWGRLFVILISIGYLINKNIKPIGIALIALVLAYSAYEILTARKNKYMTGSCGYFVMAVDLAFVSTGVLLTGGGTSPLQVLYLMLVVTPGVVHGTNSLAVAATVTGVYFITITGGPYDSFFLIAPLCVVLSLYVGHLSEDLRRQGRTDWLTGLYNRLYLSEHLDIELLRATRTGRPLSFLMFDIDGFKEVNDMYGHRRGDEILASIGQMVRDSVRKTDIPVRLGGDEFLIVLPDTTREGAEKISERIALRLQEVSLSASFGVSSYPDNGDTGPDLIDVADRTLYASRSKQCDCKQPLGCGEDNLD